MYKDRLSELAEILASGGFEILSFSESKKEESPKHHEGMTYDLKIFRPFGKKGNPNEAGDKK